MLAHLKIFISDLGYAVLSRINSFHNLRLQKNRGIDHKHLLTKIAILAMSWLWVIIFKVLLQTYIEYLRGLVEDKRTINHHGREREIDLEMEKPIQVEPAVTQAFDLE